MVSPLTWRLADLFAKHAFLIRGLGWGGMPLHMIEKDIDQGRLIVIATPDMQLTGLQLPMFAVYRRDHLAGPAGRWMIDQLRNLQ